jgi:hypothetical protein
MAREGLRQDEEALDVLGGLDAARGRRRRTTRSTSSRTLMRRWTSASSHREGPRRRDIDLRPIVPPSFELWYDGMHHNARAAADQEAVPGAPRTTESAGLESGASAADQDHGPDVASRSWLLRAPSRHSLPSRSPLRDRRAALAPRPQAPLPVGAAPAHPPGARQGVAARPAGARALRGEQGRRARRRAARGGVGGVPDPRPRRQLDRMPLHRPEELMAGGRPAVPESAREPRPPPRAKSARREPRTLADDVPAPEGDPSSASSRGTTGSTRSC